VARTSANAFNTDTHHDRARSATDGDLTVATFQAAFEDVTGWSLELASPKLEPRSAAAGPRHFVAEQDTALASGGLRFHLVPSGRRRTGDDSRPLHPADARRLAHASAQLMQELCTARAALWQREAELAAGVPVAPRTDEDQHLARRLESILHGGAEAVGCRSAALYLLDSATTQLKLRSSWGLPARRLTQPARPLRGAVADLEALVGHVVAIEDVARTQHWNVPERALAAICVPVSSPTEPLGTLWMFDHRSRPFTPEQTGLVEIIAGRVAAELQREMLLQECVSSKQLTRQLERAADWQRNHLPNVAPLLDDWQVQGIADEANALRTGFFDWFMPPDGSLAIVLGHVEGTVIEAALTMATLQTAVRAHAQYAGDATQLVARVNEALWQGSAGGNDASLFFGKLYPNSGQVDFSTAGRIAAGVQRSHGFEPINVSAVPLGLQPDDEFTAGRVMLGRGDALVVAGQRAAWDEAVGEAAAGNGRVPTSRTPADVGADDTSLDALAVRAADEMSGCRRTLLAVRRGRVAR